MKKNYPKQYIRLLLTLLIAGIQPLLGQVTNTNTGLTYATIQAAIDAPATLNSHTLTLVAGAYFENILINKELTINGPKVGVDGNHVTRGSGEAIIYPAEVLYGDGTFNGGRVIRITANNVTLDGVTVNGDNPNLTGYYSANGGDFDCDFGIISFGSPWLNEADLAGDNINIKNNIIKNFKLAGIIIWSGYNNPIAKYGQITHNKIQNTPDWYGIFLQQNYYANIEYNTFIDNKVGVVVYFFWLAKPTGTVASISHNTFTTKTQQIVGGPAFTDVRGILYHFMYNVANPWTISDNIVTNTTTGSAGSCGIEIDMDWTPENVQVSNNNINGFENGYRLVSSANPLVGSSALPTTVTGGILSNNTYGITARNTSFNDNATPAFASIFDVTGVSIQNSTTAGIFVQDNSTSLEPPMVTVNAYNCKINGGPAGILLNGEHSNATAHENDLSANSSFAINNLSPNSVNATCNWYGHWTGPTHASNIGGLGTVVSNNVAFTPWLVNGSDNNLTIPGFQPVPGSCIPIKCGNNNNKYLICHNGMTKCVDYVGALDHLAHGDKLGECTTAFIGNTEKIITSADKLIPGKNTPETFKLSVAPNPFINSTSFKYELPFDSKVTIRIYDAMGKEVASLINSEKKAGVYNLAYDASRLGSGIYYYKLIAVTKEKEFNLSGKIMKQ